MKEKHVGNVSRATWVSVLVLLGLVFILCVGYQIYEARQMSLYLTVLVLREMESGGSALR